LGLWYHDRDPTTNIRLEYQLELSTGTRWVREIRASALERIKHCLGQLNDEQVWWRSHSWLNSIGNLILHLCGNVPHFRGHTQEIIHMTRCLLGDAYKFAWTPSTPEQGAP
jgi:hypothetical protein